MIRLLKLKVVLLAIISAVCIGIVRASKFEGIPDEALPTSSGYLTIDEAKGTKMFYVYYEALSPPGKLSETPIVLWLQGGPGCSGLLGNFFELGPWVIGADQQFHPNPGSWNRIFGLLFLDNPVGTGFSIAPTEQDVPLNIEDVGEDLYTALTAFYTENPSFQTRTLYATGESYAGKYVPALGYYYLQQQEKETPVFQLGGLAIGNGLTHPVAQIPAYAPAAYYMGLIDDRQRSKDEELAKLVVKHIENGRFDLAHDARSVLMRALYEQTGFATLLDIRRELDYYTYANGSSWLSPVVNRESIKKALGAEESITWEDCTDYVDSSFRNQTMQSTKFMVEYALTKLPVLLYQGQFDLQDGVASNEQWMKDIKWTGISEFWNTERIVWQLEGVLAGHVRTYANLSHVVIVGAGHLVPADQGLRSQKMVEAWIGGSLASSPSLSASATPVKKSKTSCSVVDSFSIQSGKNLDMRVLEETPTSI
ncbi:vitellogenic carboxypeptidase-like protein [Marchantia polymorpha subsp. ruderalis]|uniref:Carboxypeptidase n=2 Tax=Marchantia polymorpha TaxID=3197 RepID=A0A176WLL1_MARPO|nr:hypothetical protein AXG93_1952s1050 [Marchantia polymorpha subsp. ruderalis]PTQ28225.1 hypothetical protein MARPO_0170s0029 [Marchantia polymorpha]BBN15042.1 hypothetical protein Mp_6g16480 [Marchantia polymorpha subsp. ruderalis]|eukprot:PTQ28225.1 hypothetical protein MARPO_0170s0029 [Marchantia polymorpha]